MPKDHFWNKRSSKKEGTLDGKKVNGLTDECNGGSVSRGSQKTKTSTSKKHLFGIDWSPILNRNGGRKTEEHGSKVPRSVSSSALAEARTIAFKRTASNGEVEQSKPGIDYLSPLDSQRQRHSSDRVIPAKKTTQIYSVPVDTIRKTNGHIEHGKVKSPSPVNSHVSKPHQQDYTDPWECASKDGTATGRSHGSLHIKTSGSCKKKENVSSASDTSVSPPPLSSDANSDDYEEPWDKLKRPNVYRKKSKEKPVGRVSPLPPMRAVPKPPVEITKQISEVPKPLSPLPDEDYTSQVHVPPRRSVSCKTAIVSDYSLPCDTKRLSDTVVNVSSYLKPVEQFPLHDDSSSEELSPTPPPLPVRYSSAPLINASLALDEQPWYHYKLSRSEAEDVLRDKADFSFLVRLSESSSDPYSLSIRNFSTGFMHLKIAYKNSMYVLGQFSKPFSTVPEAIEFYTRNKLTLKGADHKQLRHPVYKNECH